MMNRKLIAAMMCVAVGVAVAGAESPDEWFRDGKAVVNVAKVMTPINQKAKNVILFIGDGMGVSTVTAARILEGQRRGESGEENLLSFETLPYTALIKTYETNQQVPDSAGTITAIVTGVKTKAGVLSVNQNVTPGNHTSATANKLTTILELAEKAGLSTGVISTTRITHATPAACYAHTPARRWENDSELPAAAKQADFPDIARQLIEFPFGDGIEVAMGGGRGNFLPRTAKDPEDPDLTGHHSDGRDLTTEWHKKPNAAYVWNKLQFDNIDVTKVDHLLGLFDRSHMEYEHDRERDTGAEPSLGNMTGKAIDLLARNEKGFFLLVEGGRIDHAHHASNAYRALTETIEFARAVRVAMSKTNRTETLIIVTADHSHTLTIGGYPTRGNPILGKVRTNDNVGKPTKHLTVDTNGLPYTTLGYANGPGYVGGSGRRDLSKVDTEVHHYLQEAAIPTRSATHGGEDVPLYADGPMAHLFHGVLEQNVIFHVMAEALGLSQ